MQGNENGGHGVGKNQNHVLNDLRVSDAFHAAENGVEKHDAHANKQARAVVGFQKARKGHAHTFHLANDVGDGNENKAYHGHHSGSLGTKSFADEFRHGELAVLAEVGGQQQCEQHITAGPAHEKDGSSVAAESDEAGHGDEGGCTHPVRRGGHAVGNRADATASHVKFLGRLCLAPNGNADVGGEREAHDYVRPRLDVHYASSLGLVDSVSVSLLSVKPCFLSNRFICRT